ncbi:putative ATP-dependent RNA helicase TDRD12 [Genypterus blacodes]|uniref:putative ATP-dependent RNA helicase TDRD12 n=1 Tax=Genypterus blacodes TaxID=154954 RepID=UPI003F76D3B0
MLQITVVKVESPSCLWGRVIEGHSGEAERQYKTLMQRINLYYHSSYLDLNTLRPASLDKGQVCVAYWSRMKCWCRALVEAVVEDSFSQRVLCFLVDHGEKVVVPSHLIFMAVQNFLQLPFWVRRFHLAEIRPLTLQVSGCLDKVELVTARQWDSSARLYLHDLLRAATQMTAVMQEGEEESTPMVLYLTIRDIKICVNDELVAKKFARYSSELGGADELERRPLMLTSSILTPTDFLSPNKLSTKTYQLPPVTSHAQREPKTSEGSCMPKVTKREQAPDGQSAACSASGAVVRSDAAEEADSSLAADLTQTISLFRFLKFLNPVHSHQQVAPGAKTTDPDRLHESGQNLESGIISANQTPEDLNQKHTTEETTAASDTFTGNHVGPGSSGWARAAERASRQRPEEGVACSRMLEWLNPEPLSLSASDSDAAEEEVGPSVLSRSEVLVHSTLQMEPCTDLDSAPITENLCRVLRRKRYVLSLADSHSWPAVARGSNTVIVSQNAEQPLSYLPPLLTHIQLNSALASLTSSSGPIAVLLCPGWEKVQAVCDVLQERYVSHTLHPISVLLGAGKDEAKTTKIPKNCLLLVTTPFSLLRLLECHPFLFLRLYHLVLDEADQLFTLAPDQMTSILQHFQKVTSSANRASGPQQLVAVAKRWTAQMEDLVTDHMPSPCVVFTLAQEAALYSNVHQVVLMALESSKISVLLGALDFHPDVGQKTLVITDTAEEVEDVFKALNNKSAFCLKIHEGLTQQCAVIIQQWRKSVGPGTQVILVTTNSYLSSLGIRDATCVVHYSFPRSSKVFGSRLFCMLENFRDLTDRDGLSHQDQTQSRSQRTRSVLMVSERNARHVVGVLRYLRRSDALLPPELLTFAQGVHLAREEQKMDRPLCSYLKSFGVCRDSSVCPDRHRLHSRLDHPLLPSSGVVEVLPLYIKTASVFYGRIVHEDGRFASMASEMVCYYADKKPGAQQVVQGGLYAVQEDQVFHRVKVLAEPHRGPGLFFRVLVGFMDVGKEEEVKSHQLLQLPQQFHALPAQAVEIVVCRVKPADTEVNWHPKVSRSISRTIRGLQHRAHVVLSLQNTLFVDPMVRVTWVPGMKTVINEHSVQKEILNTGMALANPEHVNLLRVLYQEGVAPGSTGAGYTHTHTGMHVRLQAVEEVLDEAFRAAEVRKLVATDLHLLRWETCEAVGPPAPAHRSTLTGPPEPAGSAAVDLRQLVLSDPEASGRREEEEEEEEEEAAALDSAERTQSLHPGVQWHQTGECVFVKVKLMDCELQSCDFSADRVVFSCSVNGRSYRVDLDLHANIAADRCSWEMKSNEPVLKLVKQQQGHWDRLVRTKNIFVSHDMEHIEEDEDTAANDVIFFENAATEGHQYVSSESDSENDSESD